jgi:hypothetical protein
MGNDRVRHRRAAGLEYLDDSIRNSQMDHVSGTLQPTMIIGWREWISLPDLHLPFIKAKVDTGARTSALHSFDLKVTTERGQKRAHFKIHPVQGRNDIIVSCSADVTDYRYVSDSGGHKEKRYVIVTPIEIGGMSWEIELTLANRETMSFRMLLGRSAMKNLIIEPAHSYLLGKPKGILKTYRQHPKRHKK